MILNGNIHISEKFKSRESGYNIFVVYDINQLIDEQQYEPIKEIELTFPSVDFVPIDYNWSQILRENTDHDGFPINILYYENNILKISHIIHVSILQEFLTYILLRCDIN